MPMSDLRVALFLKKLELFVVGLAQNKFMNEINLFTIQLTPQE